MQLERARIAVLDGASGGDLANRTADYLRGLGAEITASGPAERGYSETTIIDYTGNPYTLQYFVALFGIRDSQIIHLFDPNSPVDVEIKLGSDWLNNNSLP